MILTKNDPLINLMLATHLFQEGKDGTEKIVLET
jgi:hypothetical protein